MKQKFDLRQMRREIKEDEAAGGARPVLVTQDEIRALIRQRDTKRRGKKPS